MLCLTATTFLEFLADRCNVTFGYCHNMSSVVCLSVTRVYCDKTAAVRIMQFHLIVAQCISSLPAKYDDKIRRGSRDLGAQGKVGLFSTSQCYISETV